MTGGYENPPVTSQELQPNDKYYMRRRSHNGLHLPDVFGMAAIYSPYFRAWPAVLTGYARAARLPLKVFMLQGIYDFDVGNTRQLHRMPQEKGYLVLFLETADGHSQGNWRWSLDEMLRFFFGPDQASCQRKRQPKLSTSEASWI